MERYSFSKLSSFYQCPLQYYLNYIAREQRENNAFAEYGSFVHSLLERWADGELEVYELLDKYEEDFWQQVSHEFPPNKYVDLAKKYYEDGVNFFFNFDGVDAKEILSAEEQFVEKVKCTTGKEDFLVQGFIDLVYIDTQDRLVVHDWKSKAKFKSKDEQKKYARQLYIYSYYIKKKYGRFPDLLRFHTFRNQTDVDIEFNELGYKEAMTWVQDTVERIRNCIEFNPCADDFYCTYLCDMRRSCCGESKNKQEGVDE